MLGLVYHRLLRQHASGSLLQSLCTICKLTMCCAAAGTLSGLVYMDLSGNLLSGSIPQALCVLANVSAFNLSSNQFTGERSLL